MTGPPTIFHHQLFTKLPNSDSYGSPDGKLRFLPGYVFQEWERN